jgi:hypothetical protein
VQLFGLDPVAPRARVGRMGAAFLAVLRGHQVRLSLSSGRSACILGVAGEADYVHRLADEHGDDGISIGRSSAPRADCHPAVYPRWNGS